VSFVATLLIVITAPVAWSWWWDRMQASSAWGEWFTFTGVLLLAMITGSSLVAMLRADLAYVALVVIPVGVAVVLWRKGMHLLPRIRRIAAGLGLGGTVVAAFSMIGIAEYIDRVGPYVGGSLFGWSFLCSAASGVLTLAGRGATRFCGVLASALASVFALGAVIAM
jgi:hypothetical protein